MNEAVGRTKDAGWQLGFRRTLPVGDEELWTFLLGDGLPLWLGDGQIGDKGETFTTSDGGHGEVRGRQEGRKLRVAWRPAGSERTTIVQLTVTPAATGTTLGFHQERLADADERAQMLEHWTYVVDTIADALRHPPLP